MSASGPGFRLAGGRGFAGCGPSQAGVQLSQIFRVGTSWPGAWRMLGCLKSLKNQAFRLRECQWIMGRKSPAL
jgi:hypothetical protein